MAKTLSDFLKEAREAVDEVTPDELEEWLEERDDLLLVDVREPYEYASGHIPGSVLIPRGTLEGAADPSNKHRIEALYSARERPVVVYCDTGARSALATLVLKEMGFEDVYNLAGGVQMWEAEDMETETGEYQGSLP